MMGISGVLASRGHAVFPLRDLAWGLSRIPRFGGQTIQKWFVADHLVAAGRYARVVAPDDSEIELYALLHDAHEAYTGDIPTTFKTREMRELQKELDRDIYATLGIGGLWPLGMIEHVLVKSIDVALLLAEALVVTPKSTFLTIQDELGGLKVKDEAVQIVQNVLRTGAGRYWYQETSQLIAKVTTPVVMGFDPGYPGAERAI